ncbi:hypothetical protein V1280_003307 [Bradyrhizobium sp. AZCC 2230]
MDATDRDALKRAVEIARHCQSDALDLMPWQSAPM